MKKLNPKGEGLVQNLFFLILFLGLGYAGYVYLWPMVSGSDKPAAQTASTEMTPTPGAPTMGKAGSMAGAAVQGAAAAGEVYGSGR